MLTKRAFFVGSDPEGAKGTEGPKNGMWRNRSGGQRNERLGGGESQALVPLSGGGCVPNDTWSVLRPPLAAADTDCGHNSKVPATESRSQRGERTPGERSHSAKWPILTVPLLGPARL